MLEMKGVELVEVTGTPRFATLRSEPFENDDVSEVKVRSK